jgi:hypothetical protein
MPSPKWPNNSVFRYAPPKSSIWGHKLRKMAARRQRKLVDEFLNLATVDSAFNNGSVSLPKVAPGWEPLPGAFLNLIRLFERELGGFPSTGGYYANLDQVQFDFCYNQLLQAGALDVDNPASGHLSCLITIPKWRLHGRDIPTSSNLIVHYGPLPCLSTMFRFETIDDFYSVQKILSDLGLCNLSEKHLKPCKTRSKKK